MDQPSPLAITLRSGRVTGRPGDSLLNDQSGPPPATSVDVSTLSFYIVYGQSSI